nr:hypothetical protein [Tanacetum cinerariifolium]
MFERPDRQDNVWRNQSNIHGQAFVKRWKLLTSCRVHIISLNTTQIILLVERRYPLTKFTLEQMLNVVRLQVEEETADQALSAEETDESVATPPPHPAYCMIARISILASVLVPAWSDLKVARLLVMSTPSSSPLFPLSSPPPRIAFPPLPLILSPPSPVLSPAPPPSPIRSIGYRAAMIRLRA